MFEQRDLEAAKVGLGLFEMREETLLGLELAGVNAAASGFDAHGMLEVQHLVVEKILDGAARSIGAVEDAADHDGVVRGVVVAEHAAGVVGAPGEDRAPEKAVEEARIERVEDLVEVEVVAHWGENSLAAASLADVFGLTRDCFGGDVAAVAVGVRGSDGLPVKLRKQDMRDGMVDGFGCVFQQVGESDVKASFTKPDGGVERGEAAETDIKGRHGSPRPKFAILFFEDGDDRLRGGGGCGTAFFSLRLCGDLGQGIEECRRLCNPREQMEELAQR
jgi:hypothetical protein